MAVLTVNGAAIPAPSEMNVSIFEVGSGEQRSASGNLVADVTAVKRRLSLRWAHLSPLELGGLLGNTAAALFEVSYPDPLTAATRTMTCRCGESTAGVLQIRADQPVWTDVKMEWIER